MKRFLGPPRLLSSLRLLVANGGACPYCDGRAWVECARCAKSPILATTLGPASSETTVLHAAPHEGTVARNLHRLKYEETPCLGYPLGRHFGRKLSRLSELAGATLLPVPLHAERTLERGYNQSALLARGIASVLADACVETLLLSRAKATEKQAQLEEEQRFKNLRNAFIAQRKRTSGPLWLVDDVCTTGATLLSCIAALREVGLEPCGALTISCSLSRAHRARLLKPGSS